VDPNQAPIIYPFEIQNGNGARVWYNGTSVIDQDNGVIADGKFHHFVFVSRSANDQELFVDGINIATTLAANKTLPATLTGVTIGAWNPTGQYYTGALDDVRIYNRALSAQEVQQLYALGTANIGHSNTVSLSSGLVGYWPLDGSTISWTTSQRA
jgi:Concanavalin A-like lectin/glucanases superfamily